MAPRIYKTARFCHARNVLISLSDEFWRGTGPPAPEPLGAHSYAEDWQEWYYRQQFNHILSRDYVSGTMPWVLADFRMEWNPSTGDPHPVALTNLKGLTTHDRSERKMAFDVVADIYAWGRWGRDGGE